MTVKMLSCHAGKTILLLTVILVNLKDIAARSYPELESMIETRTSMPSGLTIKLPCDAQHTSMSPLVMWTKREGKQDVTLTINTLTKDPTKYSVNDSFTLEIKNLTGQDAGYYFCMADSKRKEAREEIVVFESQGFGDVSEVNLGSSFSLSCTTWKENPRRFGYRWFHNNNSIISDDRRIITISDVPNLSEVGSRLTVNDVNLADSGSYECRSTDGFYSITRVGIIESPLPPISVHVASVSFNSVDLTWKYDGEDPMGDFHYILRFRPDHSDEDFTVIRDISSKSYTVGGLMPLTEYAFQVSAVDGSGKEGNPSDTLLVTLAALSFSLLRAVEHGHLGVVKDLLDLDPEIDEGDGMYLKMASKMGHLEVVEYLLQEGADPDADEDGEAVQEAAKNGHIEVVRALLKAGADANVGDGMHWAVTNNKPEIMKLLDKYGSDVNKPLPEKPWKDRETGAKYGLGWTALHVAARWGRVDLIDLLYQLESNLAAKDPNGDTPLHIAVKYPQIWFVRKLLKYCPDLSLENNDGKTVIDLVEDLPHAIYASLSSDEGVRLRHLVADITTDKLKTTSSTEEAAEALEEEVEWLVENNKTISDLVDAVATTDSHVDYILQELFEDTIYLEIEDAFADHLCTTEGNGEWRANIDVKYEATCVCIPGKGPTLQLDPLIPSEECGRGS